MAADLTHFEQHLVANAAMTKERMLRNGEKCCGTCNFSRPPDHPDHASHYVKCVWWRNRPLPEYWPQPTAFEYLRAHVSGTECAVYLPAPASRKPAIDPVLTATADAGLMSAGDYVMAVTDKPGFDGRDRSIGMKVSDIADPEERS